MIAFLLVATALALGTNFQDVPPHTPAPSAQRQTKSDREKAGLRGSVKSVVSETSYSSAAGIPERTFTIATEYDEAGREVSINQKFADQPASITTRTYDENGRLLKVSFRTGDGPKRDSVYSYDENGRLIGVTTAGEKNFSYEYDSLGKKTSITSFAANVPATAAAAYAWAGGADLAFQSPPGGKMLTRYDELDRPLGAEIYDSHGTLVGRIVRSMDAAGRPMEDRYITEEPSGMLPDELARQLNPEQQKALSTWMAIRMGFSRVSYRYDAQGRLVSKHREFAGTKDDTTFTYNENGDAVEESQKSVTETDSDAGYELGDDGSIRKAGTSKTNPETESVARHEYQYDSFGNWTEHKVMYRSQVTASYEPSQTVRRKITYY